MDNQRQRALQSKLLKGMLNQLDALDNEIVNLKKVDEHQEREIEDLKMEVRNLKMINKINSGVKMKDIAREENISAGRVSQIYKEYTEN